MKAIIGKSIKNLFGKLSFVLAKMGVSRPGWAIVAIAKLFYKCGHGPDPMKVHDDEDEVLLNCAR